MVRHPSWLGLLLLALAIAFAAGIRPKLTVAQAPSSLDDETMLALVLPPLPDGSRPGVHLWARADQERGPGGLPTVFVVTLYTSQGSNGPEEREVVNYLQYSNGAWIPARPRDAGTLLTQDWAWLSLNLKNLTASASGQGDSSQYTVDYSASGTYAGSPRELDIEEIYGADLSLLASAVLVDTANPATSASATTAPAPSRTPPAVTVTPQPSIATATATAAAATSPTGTPGGTTIVPPTSTPGAATAVPSGATATAVPGGSNTIRPASATP